MSDYELPLCIHVSQFNSENDTVTLNLLVGILSWKSSPGSVRTFIIVSAQEALFRFTTQWLILFQ